MSTVNRLFHSKVEHFKPFSTSKRDRQLFFSSSLPKSEARVRGPHPRGDELAGVEGHLQEGGRRRRPRQNHGKGCQWSILWNAPV